MDGAGKGGAILTREEALACVRHALDPCVDDCPTEDETDEAMRALARPCIELAQDEVVESDYNLTGHWDGEHVVYRTIRTRKPA